MAHLSLVFFVIVLLLINFSNTYVLNSNEDNNRISKTNNNSVNESDSAILIKKREAEWFGNDNNNEAGKSKSSQTLLEFLAGVPCLVISTAEEDNSGIMMLEKRAGKPVNLFTPRLGRTTAIDEENDPTGNSEKWYLKTRNGRGKHSVRYSPRLGRDEFNSFV